MTVSNDILFRYHPTGASEATASQAGLHAGVAASQQIAQLDLPKLKPYAASFIAVAQKYSLPPALLAAIASRESRAGSGLKNGWGDHGNGYGIMQVDKRSHKPAGGPTSQAHIDQAASILKDSVTEVTKKHPSWTPEEHLRGGVAAYNFGVSNVQTVKRMDEGSTGGDYSNDVWARAQVLAPAIGGVSDQSQVPVQPAPPKQSPPVVATSPGKADKGKSQGDPGVKELQEILVKYGFMTEQQMQTGPGILGSKTRAAVTAFMETKGRATATKPVTTGGNGTTPQGNTQKPTNGTSTGTSKPPVQVFPTKSVAMIDGVPLYKQGDAAWGNRYLGSGNNLTIHAAGCAMTAMAMAISKISGQSINPKELDEYLDSHNGYSGNSLLWDVAAKSRKLVANRQTGLALVMLDKELAAGRPVVVGVDYKAGSNGGANGTDHWVTITGKYTEGGKVCYSAHDPASGGKFTFFQDGTRLRASVSKGALHDYVTTGEACLLSNPQSKSTPVTKPPVATKPPVVAQTPKPGVPVSTTKPGDKGAAAVPGLDPRGKLSAVHPRLSQFVLAMGAALAKRGVPIMITDGVRTFAEQDKLYDQGRKTKGPVVTKARGGYSNHNYGLAVDVVPLVNGKPNWNVSVATWNILGEEGRRAGLEWGGDWKEFVDRPHFQLPVGLSVDQCLKIYQKGGMSAVWAEADRKLPKS